MKSEIKNKSSKFVACMAMCVVIISVLASCKKNNEESKESNPLVGVWRSAETANKSWDQYTFNDDKTYQYREYDGPSQITWLMSGSYDYSKITETVTFSVEKSDFSNMQKGDKFVRECIILSDAIILSGYTYNKR